MIINKSLVIVLGLVSFSVVSGSILSNSFVFADDVVDEINITVPVSCTMSGTGMASHNAEIQNNTYASNIGATTLHAFCNDTGGFAIYAVGFTDNEFGKTVLTNASLGTTFDIVSGTADSGDTSNWAMELAITQDTNDTTNNPTTLDNSFGSYHVVPSTYTKVAHKNTATDMTDTTGGVKLTTTYAAFISKTQPAGTYTGQVKYTLVHPATETPLQPQTAISGCINYFANASTAVGTMGCQTINDGSTVRLYASNFSRAGYGFAGWSDVYDYATNSNAEFYGPNEDFVVPNGAAENGLSLYAVWVKSIGAMQDDASSVCNALTATTFSKDESDESIWSIGAGLSNVTALTDVRDGNTYAIAKLTDGNCWMIENLRLDSDSELTVNNTNNPLTNGDLSNPIVALKHNYGDLTTYNTLSATSSVAYDANTAPDGWCSTNSAACNDQSRLRTDNTANRVVYATMTSSMTSHTANFYTYGNYYNWYSATAGRGTFTYIGANVDGDICPYGWHLPTGSDLGEFGSLSNSLGGYQIGGKAMMMTNSTVPTVAIMSKRLRHFPNNYIYSGYAMNSSISSRGLSGDYWSSTGTSVNNYAYYFSISSSEVNPGVNVYNYKYNGRMVRCIVN